MAASIKNRGDAGDQQLAYGSLWGIPDEARSTPFVDEHTEAGHPPRFAHGQPPTPPPLPPPAAVKTSARTRVQADELRGADHE